MLLPLECFLRLADWQRARRAEDTQHRVAPDTTGSSSQPNPSLYAMSLQHTCDTYVGPLSSDSSYCMSSNVSTVLQAVTNIITPPVRTIRGATTLFKEGLITLADLKLHPIGQLCSNQRPCSVFHRKVGHGCWSGKDVSQAALVLAYWACLSLHSPLLLP